MAATALTHGSVRLAAFEPTRIGDPEAPLSDALLQRLRSLETRGSLRA